MTNLAHSIKRREFLRVGLSGFATLSLPGLLQMRARAALEQPKEKTAVILVWLRGGASHLETYDPKPEASSAYRGPWGAIETNVSGIRISEQLPLHAKHADKMVFLRSVHHKNGDHFAAGHWMLTGRYGSHSTDKDQKYPSVGAYVSRVQGARAPGVPAYVGLPSAQSIYLFPGYQGAAYLGPAFNPFDVNTAQKYLAANHAGPVQKPQCLDNFSGDVARTQSRVDLLTQLDGFRRDLDRGRLMDAMDRYQAQAVDMVTGNRAREAFDIEREDAKTRDRYGRGPWGHYTLLARRLVESGVSFVTVDMPHWDDHSGIAKGHGYKLPVLDRAVGALVEDLSDRGMLNDVLVMVMGEFGRTPKINEGQPGIPIPGRDHWGDVFSVMLAGGGLKTGQVIGASSVNGEFPIERPLTPADVLATVYHMLGIDPEQTFNDFAGRPVPIIDGGQAIREII